MLSLEGVTSQGSNLQGSLPEGSFDSFDDLGLYENYVGDKLDVKKDDDCVEISTGNLYVKMGDVP